MKTMICVDHTGYCSFNYEAFQAVNKRCELGEEVSIATVNMTNQFIQLKTAIYNIVEMHSFSNGVLIASTIRNAKRVLSCSNTSKKVLYLYDIDWMNSIMSYSENYDVLTNKNLLVICRSESHQEVIEKSFGIKAVIIEKFDLEKIWNLLG